MRGARRLGSVARGLLVLRPGTVRYLAAGSHGRCKVLGNILVNRGDHGEDALIAYLPGFLEASTASDIFRFCERDVDWTRETDDFGPQERLSYYVGDPGCSFAYVGLSLQPHPWPQG